jgi:WD40 repeat protein
MRSIIALTGIISLIASGLPNSGDQSETCARSILTAHDGRVRSLEFDPTGETLASIGVGGSIRLWDVAGAQEIDAGRLNTEPPFCLDFSPDGKTLAIGGRKQITLWDPSKCDEPKERWPSGAISTIQTSPDGKSILTADYQGVVRLWDAARRPATAAFDTHQSGIIRLKFAAGGVICWAAYGADLRARIWRKTSEGPPLSHKLPGGGYLTLAFSDDGRQLFAGSRVGYIQVWDVAGGRPLERFEVGAAITCLAVSPDGRLLAYGDSDGAITIFEPATRKTLLSRPAHDLGAWALAFSPDGRLLASGGHDTTIKLWDVPQVPADRRGHPGPPAEEARPRRRHPQRRQPTDLRPHPRRPRIPAVVMGTAQN